MNLRYYVYKIIRDLGELMDEIPMTIARYNNRDCYTDMCGTILINFAYDRYGWDTEPGFGYPLYWHIYKQVPLITIGEYIDEAKEYIDDYKKEGDDFELEYAETCIRIAEKIYNEFLAGEEK